MGYLSHKKYGNISSMANRMATRQYAASVGGVSNNEIRLCTKSYAVDSLNIKLDPISGYSSNRIIPEYLVEKNITVIKFIGTFRGGGIDGSLQEVGVERDNTNISLNSQVTINISIRYAISIGRPITTITRSLIMIPQKSEIFMTFKGEIYEVSITSISPSSSGDQEYVF